MTINSVPVCSRSFAGAIKTTALVLALVVLSACGGNKKTSPVAAQDTVDITKPPQTIDGVNRTQAQERDPEETISFDEWRKRRLQELQEQQTP